MIVSSPPATDRPADEAHDETESAVGTEVRHLVVPAAGHGARVDKTIADAVPEFSRSYLQQLISEGNVQLNGISVTKPSIRAKAGDKLVVELKPTAQSMAFKPEPMHLDVVFQDDYLVVINKPAGLVVHPAPGNWTGTLLNGLLARDAQCALLPRAGIVHRLDKDTSGLMVVARTRQTMDRLVEMIAARSVNRQYLALAHEVWRGPPIQQVVLAIGRDPRNRLRMAAVDLEKTSGKAAATNISLLSNSIKHCFVLCKLHTGRTHQIRVHMAALGHPLVGDETYGGRPCGGMARQALHAWRLEFDHPLTGQALKFESVLPGDMRAAIAALGVVYTT